MIKLIYYILEILIEVFNKNYFIFLELYINNLTVKSQITLSNLNHCLHYKENAIFPGASTFFILIQNTPEIHLVSDFICLMSKYIQKLHRIQNIVPINI